MLIKDRARAVGRVDQVRLSTARLFLSEKGMAGLVAGLNADQGTPDVATSSFFDRLTYDESLLASGVTSRGAYLGVGAVVRQAFPETFS